MGLFSKKDPCPVCGGDVKGLFLTKIANKQILCKKCSSRISMKEEFLKNATPELIREHLEYRQKNAERYTTLDWDMEYNAIPDMRVGVDLTARAIYLVHSSMNDEDNPVIFSFDQITGYELYRLKKEVDSADIPGDTSLDSGLTALASVARLVNNDNSTGTDYFILKLTTTEPYWPELELEISFSPGSLHEFGGFDDEMEAVCQMLKHIVRGEPVSI